MFYWNIVKLQCYNRNISARVPIVQERSMAFWSKLIIVKRERERE